MEVMAARRLMAELSSPMGNISHPMPDALTGPGSSASDRPPHPCCERGLTAAPSLLLLSALLSVHHMYWSGHVFSMCNSGAC